MGKKKISLLDAYEVLIFVELTVSIESKLFHLGYNKNYQHMRLFVLCPYFLFLRLFPTCFGPSWAHHQGYFKLLFLCYHLVRAVLC